MSRACVCVMMAGMTEGRWRSRRLHQPRARVALAGVLLLAACTGGGGGPGGSGRPTEPLPVALELRLAPGHEGLSDQQRSELETGVGDALSAYVVDAFLGDYPRYDFVRSLDSFTTGEARRAAGDIDLLTGERFKDAEAVRATSLTARIAAAQDASGFFGATAHVAFAFEATVRGEPGTEQFVLTGRLMLVKEQGRWSIFGYDVRRDDPPRTGP